MPLCAIKGCRNQSAVNTEAQGITYHRFPRCGTGWNNDWVQVVRQSRGDNDWLPHSRSVICSRHFDMDAFYTTKTGIRAVIPQAVPKLMLPGKVTVEICLIHPASHNTDGTPNTTLQQGNASELPQVPLNTENCDTFVCNNCGHRNELPAPGSQTPLQVAKIKEEVITNDEPLQAITHDCPSMPLSFPQTEEITGLITNEHTSLPSVPSLKSCLEKDIQRKNKYIESYKKKIKTLHQKVRRLERRNLSLKNRLKSLDEGVMDSTDTE